MSIARRPVLAFLGALVCVVLILAASGPALAASQVSTEALLAQERYLSSFGASAPSSGPSPEERYYSSYGPPDALPAPSPPSPSAEPALPVILLAGAAAALVVLGATGGHHLRVQRRWGARHHTDLVG